MGRIPYENAPSFEDVGSDLVAGAGVHTLLIVVNDAVAVVVDVVAEFL